MRGFGRGPKEIKRVGLQIKNDEHAVGNKFANLFWVILPRFVLSFQPNGSSSRESSNRPFVIDAERSTDMKAALATHTQYNVVRNQGQWKIALEGVHYGPYATQRDAVRAAVDAANEAGRRGLNGQVLLQDQFRTEWTYGKDPYPPHSSDYL
jgi:hypothetical protein